MATCRAVVNGALRKLGKLASGREARSTDATDALASLKGLYRSLIDSGAFGRLRDVVPVGDYTAHENERIFRNSDVDVEIEITLPELVRESLGSPAEYGSRWVPPASVADADLRPPRDCSVVVISDAHSGETQEYIYDGSIRRWIQIGDLGLDDLAPLSTRDEDGLKAALALQIADEYGGDVTGATSRLAGIFRSNLVSGFSRPRREAYGSFY